jgi:phosphatidylinositol-4,5-bisphosphate 3-kinase
MVVPKHYEQDLKDIVERDPLHPLFEQDKELIWRFK